MAADSASYVSYLETSMILAAILDEDAGAFASLNVTTPRITSALTVAEASRAIRRARAAERIGARQERTAHVALEVFFGTCSVVDINGEILLRAGRRFPIEPVRTLDAIHLATVESVGIPPHLVRVITRDRRVRENALAMGYSVS
ncbi:MAG: PIN domain-containing protein [Gemmatimonadaceae bacterium]